MFRRVLAVCELAGGRVRGRVTGADAGRLRLCIIGVALAVALMIVVSGIAIGLASQSTVQSHDVDYWITPADTGTGSMVLPEDDASLGAVHDVTADLAADDRIDYASPVLLEPVRVAEPGAENHAYVVAIGVIPETDREINGIPIDQLDQSYSYYNDGGYDGEWSGDAVVTEATLELLETEDATILEARSPTGTYDLTVVDRSEATVSSGLGDVPVVVLPLAELQTIAGLEEADQADQILVSTTDPDVREDVAGTYPGTNVVTRAGPIGEELTTSSLPLAMATSSLLVALTVGVLFVATMMGLELTANRQYLATLDAIGFSTRSRALLVSVETLTLSVIGGIAGLLVGVVGIHAVNWAARDTIGVAVAQFDPILLGYGAIVALVIGTLAAPYPVWIASRVETLEVIGQ